MSNVSYIGVCDIPNQDKKKNLLSSSTSKIQLPVEETQVLSINCVLVGDEKVGKTSILNAYISPPSTGFIPGQYGSTTREDYVLEKQVKDGFGHKHRILLNIVDTGGQKELDRLRPLCYNQADVFFLCFNVVVPSSFQSLMTKWLPEIKRHADHKKVSLFLIGTQSDLRSNTNVLLKLSSDGLSPISESRAVRLCEKIGAKNYIECSSLTQKNIRRIFDHVMITGLHQHSRKIPQHNQTGKKYHIQNEMNNGAHEIHKPMGKENKAYNGKQGRGQLRQTFSNKWNVRKCYKMKRLVFFSCLFN